MYQSVIKEIEKSTKVKDWKTVFGLYWYIGWITGREAERLYFQKYLVVTLEGNYWRKNGNISNSNTGAISRIY